MKTETKKPHGSMSAEELIALFHDKTRHVNALSYEMKRAPKSAIVALAYGEFASEAPASEVPDELGSLAYDEMERRQRALDVLIRTNPTLAIRKQY